MTPTQARLAAERRARLERMHQASLQHFDRCYDEAQKEPPPARRIVNNEAMPAPMRRPHQVTVIQEMICERFGITRDDLIGPCRKTIYTKPRQLAMYLTRELTDLSFPQIGKRFGGKDHTSILHACRQIKMLVAYDTELAGLACEIAETVNNRVIGTNSTSAVADDGKSQRHIP